VNIANAKWHGSAKVDLEDVLLLQQVRRKVGAHKAMLITNTDFGSGARRAAADEGIALLVVRPVFNPALLDGDPRVHVQDRFKELAAAGATIYGWHVVQKGLGGAGSVAEVLGLASPMTPGGAPCQGYPTRSMTGPGPAPAASRSAGNRGGYATRHGPGPGFRMK
jgi:Restriction endonuclease